VCGRINISSHPLAEVFMELAGAPFPVEDRENLAPTEPAPIVRNARGGGAREVAVCRWWLIPYWSREPATKYAMFNAKAETLQESRAFQEPFARRRCVVPVSGFYEWAKRDGRRLPYYIRSLEDEGLLLAGVWDRWRGRPDDDRTIESFAIITVPVSPQLAFVHDRQPAMLARSNVDEWLDRATAMERARALLSPRVPSALAAVPVSTYVNNSRNQGPRCTEPVATPIELPSTAG
jgi:putative SOS response-associated peptidase YedK